VSLHGREFVTTVYSNLGTAGANSAFITTSALLRPTDFSTFSWLAAIANKFEEFKFHQLVFTYEPQCSTATSGSVGMWFDTDPTHTPPSNWNAMINTGANLHGAPWAKHTFSVPTHCFSSRKTYYTKREFPDLQQQPNAASGFNQSIDPMENYAGCYGFASQDVLLASTNVPVPLGKVYLDYALTLRQQSVDSWSKTNLPNYTPVSTVIADNSGSGSIIFGGLAIPGGKGLAFTATTNAYGLLGSPVGTGAAGSLLTTLYGTPQALTNVGSVTCGVGDQYFNYVNGIAYAKQDLQLAVDIGATMSVSSFTSTQLGIVPAGQPLTSYFSVSSAATQEATFAGTQRNGSPLTTAAQLHANGVQGLFQLGNVVASPTIIAATTFAQSWLVNLNQGDAIWFSATPNASAPLNSFTVGMSPMTYGMTY